MKSHKIILTVASFLILAQGPSYGATYEMVFQGTVWSGTDVSGLFGVANADLANDTYTATYTYDPTLGNSVKSPGVTIDGGSSKSTKRTTVLSPILSASITIDGVTYNLPSNSPLYYGYLETTSNSIYPTIADFCPSISCGNMELYNTLNVASSPDLTTLGSYSVSEDDSGAGFFIGEGDDINLAPTSVEIGVMPLPGASSLLIAGLSTMLLFGQLFVRRAAGGREYAGRSSP